MGNDISEIEDDAFIQISSGSYPVVRQNSFQIQVFKFKLLMKVKAGKVHHVI